MMRLAGDRRKRDNGHGLSLMYPLRPCFVVLRVGRSAVESIASSRLCLAFSPLLLGEGVASNVTLAGHVQREAFFYIMSHPSICRPVYLAWSVQRVACVIGRCSPAPVSSAANLTAWLAGQPLLQQVIAIGVHGGLASSVAAAVVQVGGRTFVLLRRALSDSEFSQLTLQQYRHDVFTILVSAGSSVVGGSCGAVLGGLALPGVGTVVGCFVGSLLGGLAPYKVCGEGPEKEHRRLMEHCCNPTRPLKVLDDDDGWLVVSDCEGESKYIFFDRLDNYTEDLTVKSVSESSVCGVSNASGDCDSVVDGGVSDLHDWDEVLSAA
ncbi:unnamed protein product [Trypanosoma congolense IL3000]|uniref:WGS project CAEQ00000000 data, annotated contig 401 n=1 Tax=Trypanosoma congolense (strain IL3000) TaxID=1068625 RepID=F9WFL8_TRYCI|nr:unnamed protein product [Trypanosoma congolense IL3000]